MDADKPAHRVQRVNTTFLTVHVNRAYGCVLTSQYSACLIFRETLSKLLEFLFYFLEKFQTFALLFKLCRIIELFGLSESYAVFIVGDLSSIKLTIYIGIASNTA